MKRSKSLPECAYKITPFGAAPKCLLPTILIGKKKDEMLEVGREYRNSFRKYLLSSEIVNLFACRLFAAGATDSKQLGHCRTSYPNNQQLAAAALSNQVRALN